MGSRIWPLGRQAKPKQFLDLLCTGRTLKRQTVDRCAKIIPIENFIIVTNHDHKDLVAEQIPEIAESQILCEPIGRNTAACIAYAACHLRAKDPDSTMVVTPSDHLIIDESQILTAIETSIDFVGHDQMLMTIGIEPSRPDTGYGYIQTSTQIASQIYKAKTFVEKPQLEMAKVFVDNGDFYWNSGIFIWQTKSIIAALSEFMPENQELFESISSSYNTPQEQDEINKIVPSCDNISIDFGVMEKAQNVFIHSCDCGWADIGTWDSYYDLNAQDQKGNICSGNVITYNTSGCIVKASDGKAIIVDSLDDFIVVENQDVIMICPRDKQQNIKQYINDIKYKTNGKFS